MFKAKVSVNSKDFYRCNYFYIKKYFSVRELILIAVLIVLSVVLYVLFRQSLIIILCAVTIALILFAFGLYAFTAKLAYKQEYVKKGISYLKMYFHNDGFLVESYDSSDNFVTKDSHNYAGVDKIAFRKDRIYIYTGIALMYYIKSDALFDGDYEDLKAHLQACISPEKFKMKTKIRQFPGYSVHQQRKDKLNKDATTVSGDDGDIKGE